MTSSPLPLPDEYQPSWLVEPAAACWAQVEGLGLLRDTLKEAFNVSRTNPAHTDEDSRALAWRHKNMNLEYLRAQLRREDAENEWARYAENLYAANPLPPYAGTTLGSATYLGEAEGGTVEWHTLRQRGFGGSQVLDVAGYEVSYKTNRLKHKSTSGKLYGTLDMLTDKTADPATLVGETSDAADRGHLWEPVLLDAYRRDRDVNVVIGKQTWQGSYPWQVVNVDGIVVDDEGVPCGLVECKNSNSAGSWKNGIPVAYRAQMLYYLDATGLPYVDLISRVNGDVTVTRLHIGDHIDPGNKKLGGLTIEKLHADLERAWVNLQSVISGEADLEEFIPARRREVIEDSPTNMRDCTDNVWALLHHCMTRDQVSAEINMRRNGKGGLDTAVRSLLRERFDLSRIGVLCGVDGEVASAVSDDFSNRPFSPAYADWIETGIVEMRANSTDEIAVDQRLHGVDPRILELNGTGAQHIHNITPEMVRGLTPLDHDPESIAWIRGYLERAGVMVAHNVKFEKEFLAKVMPRAVRAVPWLDTQWLVKHFVPAFGASDTNKLEAFVTAMGGEYVGAHRAGVDTKMMMEALRALFAENWLD